LSQVTDSPRPGGGSLWGGRFSQDTDRLVLEYTASIPFDRRLYRQDIAGSIAHVRMLGQQGILAPEEAAAIETGLRQIRDEIERGEFPFRLDREDIHLNVESRLREILGEVAGKLHTARSRNDQVALDFRLFVRDAILQTVARLLALQKALLRLAEAHFGVILPGYTHLQRAQPILLSHHLLAYCEMFGRDVERFQDCYRRANISPLGAGALAGVPYPIDREAVARELGMDGITANSLDAVSDRDFAVEYAAAAALTMVHLSRLSEELILWSSEEFGFIELSDAYCTGSSIMPQKKNPDVPELARGKTGRVIGHLVALLAMLKAQPLAYNKDNQEDKEAIFDTADTLLSSLEVFAGLLDGLTIRRDRMEAAVSQGFLLATDLADYLVAKGLPFRDAHAVVGRMVRWCLDHHRTLASLTLNEYRQFSPLFAEDVKTISIQSSVASRDVPGGTAPKRVREALAKTLARLAATETWIAEKQRQTGNAPAG